MISRARVHARARKGVSVRTRAVADQIRAVGKLPPLTDEQKAERKIQHEIFRQEQEWQAEQRRIVREHQRAIEQERAQRQAAIAAAEANRKVRREREKEISRQVRERELRDLRLEVTQQGWWQKTVENATRQAATLQAQTTLMGELEKMLAPPAPEPEPTVVYADDDLGSPNIGDENFNPRYWLHKPILWG